jgi:release factor glutamine methyltransferase
MPPDIEWFSHAISQLKKHTPVQHITGKTEFFELTLKAGPEAMIPRPETEELVQWILDDHAGEWCRILDVGTGSGCIALALAKNLLEAAIVATDISPPALDLARENARRLGLTIEFVLNDIRREELPAESSIPDLIVSNPPYIPMAEREYLDANVRDFEPPLALFVPDEDPLLYYRHIAGLGKKVLHPGGMLYLEIHEKSWRQMKDLLQKSGFENIELRKDINGKDRMISACKK